MAATTAASKSKLEKTIQILEELSEQQLDMVYSYAQFVNARAPVEPKPVPQNVGEIVERLSGLLLPDEGKSAKDYKWERLSERYGPFD